MADRDDSDDAARRRTAGRTERVTSPGIPGMRLPPRPDPEKTPARTPEALRARQATQRGLQPPRSLSPVPSERSPLPAPAATESQRPVVQVDTAVGRVAFRRSHLRAVWAWIAPLVISALGFVGSAIRGYYLGLAMAHDELVKVRAAQQLDHDRLTKLEMRTDADEGAAAQEATSNRAERATAMRKLSDFAADLETVKGALPKIQGLPNKKP